MQNLSKTTNTSYFGIFWLTDTPQHCVNGYLSIDYVGTAKLLLIQSIKLDKELNAYEWLLDIPVIHGLVVDTNTLKNISVKLYDVYQVRQSNARLNATFLQSEKLLMGNSSGRDSSLFYNTLMLYSHHLADWLNIKVIDFNLGYDGNDEYLITAKQKKIDPISLFKDKYIHIYIYTRQYSEFGYNKPLTIGNEAFLKIEFKTPKELQEIVAYKLMTERFYTAYFEDVVHFTQVEVHSLENTQYEVRLNEDARIGLQLKRTVKTKVFLQNSQLYFANWFRIYNELSEAITTFFYAYQSRKMDVQNKFLNYVFSLEQYHRKRVNNKQPLTAKDKRMYDKALSEVKSDTASWLAKRLSGDREIQLTVRLNELYELVADKSGLAITPEMIKRIKSNRHYLVHLDEKQKADSYTGSELLEINRILSELFLRLLKQEVVLNTIK